MNPHSVFIAICSQQWAGLKREHAFAPPRKWRFDLAWPKQRIACEIEGGVWVSGRHTRGAGYESDCEKYSAAAASGWRVIRVTPGMIKSGKAIELLELAFQNSAKTTKELSDDLVFLRKQAD